MWRSNIPPNGPNVLRPMDRLCVFCGSALGARPEYSAAARAFGGLLAERGIGLVYGGGGVGLMGVLADAALARGGEVIGVIPRSLVEREVGHRGVSELMIVEDMHERKARMTGLADAFAALPGGSGTLDELFEAFTWRQLGLHSKPIGLLDVQGYWGALLTLLDRALSEGFLRSEHRALLVVEADPARLLERLESLAGPLVTGPARG